MSSYQERHMRNNLKSGFRVIGIYPLHRNKVLERLPKAVLEENLGSMTEREGKVFLEELSKERKEMRIAKIVMSRMKH